MKQTVRQMVLSWIYYMLRDKHESGIKVAVHGWSDNKTSFKYRGRYYQVEIKEVAGKGIKLLENV